MTTTQTRNPITEAFGNHAHKPAASLIARQYTSSITASQAMPAGKDSALVDATAGAVAVTLPLGSEAIIGLLYTATKTDNSANAVSLAAAGTNTFADATTSISTTASGGLVAAVWDGSVWRRAFPTAAADGGPATFSTATIGDGTGSPALTMNKSAAGTDTIALQAASVLRGRIMLDASENLVLAVLANDGTTVNGSIQISVTTGIVVIPIASVPAYNDDAAAAAGSVPVGGIYRTASALKIRVS